MATKLVTFIYTGSTYEKYKNSTIAVALVRDDRVTDLHVLTDVVKLGNTDVRDMLAMADVVKSAERNADMNSLHRRTLELSIVANCDFMAVSPTYRPTVELSP